MGKEKLRYCDWVFIENALCYYVMSETRLMEENMDIYTSKDVEELHDSVYELISRISKIKEGE